MAKNCNLRMLSCEYDCLANIGTKKAFILLLVNWVKCQRATCADLKQSKTKIYDKMHLFVVVDFGCNW